MEHTNHEYDKYVISPRELLDKLDIPPGKITVCYMTAGGDRSDADHIVIMVDRS